MDENTTLINITIDEDLRTLTIPTNGTVFGVVGDISVNRVMFVLPRYFRGFDLTQCVARVNYCNPNGDANYYEADDLAETEGKATFTWLMAPDVTSYIGDVKFSIQLYKKDETGKIIKNFNTKYSTGKVLEGYNVEQSVTPEQQETLVEKLSKEVKDSISESLKTETSEAISAEIEKKKTDALTEMNDKKTSALTEIENKKTAAVNEVNSEQVVTDVSKLKEDLGEFVTKEKSVNLLNPENIITGHFYGTEQQDDGSYKIALSENSLFSCAYIDITEGKNYIATGISYNAYNADDEGNVIGIASHASISVDTPTFDTSQKFGGISKTATRLYFSWRTLTYPAETFMIVEGAELPSTYIPYYIKKYINSDVEIDYQQLKNAPFEEIKLYVGFGKGENHFNTVVDAFKKTEKQEGHYTVYIAEGTYDMFEEYGGLASLQNFDSSVDTPYNTQPWLYNVHVIGCGRVKLTYNPQTNDYSEARWLYSPVNVRGEVTLENIEIYCNGGRYCIHDETGNIADYYDKEHVYKNVICETGANTSRCIGGGCDYGQRYLLENCSFKSGYSKDWTNAGIVSWHNRKTTRGCTFVFNNCKFTHTDDSKEHSDLRFSNVGTGNALSNVYLNNCYFSYGQIRLAIESETNPSDNQYQIICSNCNKQSLLVDELLGDNQYPLIEYNPINQSRLYQTKR